MLAPLGSGQTRIIPARWKAYLAGRMFRRILPGQTHRLYLNALLTRNSILPRELHDNLALAFHGLGATLRFVRSNQLGGVIEGIEPHRPTTFKDKYPPRKPAKTR
jgi:predicted Abi (CAAX) family protease